MSCSHIVHFDYVQIANIIFITGCIECEHFDGDWSVCAVWTRTKRSTKTRFIDDEFDLVVEYLLNLGYPGGLINYGNNCFANAIVQCLAASSIFIRWLEQTPDNHQLARILFDLIQSINGQTITYSDESTVATLIDHMRQPRWLNPYEQQDSHEFFVALINCLTSSQRTATKHFGFAACLDNDENESLMITESPLITPHPFQGLQATQLQCMACKHKVIDLLLEIY